MDLSKVCKLVSTVCVWITLMSLCSGPVWGSPYDVDKYWDSIPTGLDTDTSDSLMCWAATGSNVLTYTNWYVEDTTNSYSKEYDVYHEFLANYPNERGSGTKAYDAYFGWHHPSETATVVQLYPDPADPETFRTEMFNLKNQGYGLYLSINMGHAITMWDYEVLAGGGYRITVTDSDSDGPGSDTQTYEIVESGGYWRLQDFYGSDNWYIRRVDALQQRYPMLIEDFLPLYLPERLTLDPWVQIQAPVQLPYTLYRYSTLAVIPEQFEGPFAVTTIPAPSVAMLVLTGLATLGGAARRRKAK
ncbi:MAG: VPLPA-CTERM sorting domain-containing protein [Sedimentisphaerales bacterium]|nr:VPLPA-CTERM sorting domain-containing protein [Sedimentisphaerales bacterium]